jgi:hypothetical protein
MQPNLVPINNEGRISEGSKTHRIPAAFCSYIITISNSVREWTNPGTQLFVVGTTVQCVPSPPYVILFGMLIMSPGKKRKRSGNEKEEKKRIQEGKQSK